MLSQTQKEYITSNYKNQSAVKIAEAISVTESQVRNFVFKSTLYKTNRKYSFEESYFSNLNDENCYWGGFIASDGYVRHKPYPSLSIRIGSKDSGHLETFKSNVKYNGNIKHSKHSKESKGILSKNCKCNIYYSSEINIYCCDKIIVDLEKYFNIVPKKSLILSRPNIPNNLYGPYIKGLIDGDGSISLSKENRISLSICGTEDICRFIKEYCDDICPAKVYTVCEPRQRIDRTTKNHWTYKVSGYRALIILEHLKNIKTPFLDRKWSKVTLAKRPSNKYKTCYYNHEYNL